MWKRKSSLALLVMSAVAVASHAHHSFTSTYLEDQSIEIEGDIVQFMFRNPHSFVHVMVEDESGATHRWAAEWGGAGALAGDVSRETLRPGDHVIITGSPGRSEADRRIRIRRLFRPSDGWEWAGDFD